MGADSGRGAPDSRSEAPERWSDVSGGVLRRLGTDAVEFTVQSAERAEAAGPSRNGAVTVFRINASSITQKDSAVLRDICLHDPHVVFALEGAGIADIPGADNQDLSFLPRLDRIGDMAVLMPKNRWELEDMLAWAVHDAPGHAAVCFPSGEAFCGLQEFRAPVRYGKWEILYDESDVCLLACGNMVQTAFEVRDLLKRNGYNCSLINCRFVRPLDEETLRSAAAEHALLVTMEEHAAGGGFGESVEAFLSASGIRTDVECAALPDVHMEADSAQLLRQEGGISTENILRRVQTRMIGKIR